jgi:DnaK suppressor protein
MPTRKPVAKASKASKAVAARKPAARKPVARTAAPVAAAAKSKTIAAKPVARKSSISPKESVPKTPAKVTPQKPATVTAKTAVKSATVVEAKPAAAAVNVVTAIAVRSSAAIANRAAEAHLTGPSSPGLLGSDGDDSEEGHNLLAGPRNVKPYIVKRGEQYMNKEQTEHFRKILLAWKRDLMVEVDRTVSHMKDEAANFPDPNDRATQEEEFSLELRTRDRETRLSNASKTAATATASKPARKSASNASKRVRLPR